MLKLSASKTGVQAKPKVPALALPPPGKHMPLAVNAAQLCQVACKAPVSQTRLTIDTD